MKVQICTGSKCTFFGASSIIDSVYDLHENIHEYPGIPEDAEFDIEIIPCQQYCIGDYKNAPVVYIDGELIKQAKSQEVMAQIIDKLKED